MKMRKYAFQCTKQKNTLNRKTTTTTGEEKQSEFFLFVKCQEEMRLSLYCVLSHLHGGGILNGFDDDILLFLFFTLIFLLLLFDQSIYVACICELEMQIRFLFHSMLKLLAAIVIIARKCFSVNEIKKICYWNEQQQPTKMNENRQSKKFCFFFHSMDREEKNKFPMDRGNKKL